jgi:phosphate transport system substrate-binding protein
MKRIVFFISILLVLCSCSSTPIKVALIRIKGSDTMLKLMEALTAEYRKSNPGIFFTVKGGGTALGINALINSDVDICAASRTFEPNETKLLAEKYGTIGISTSIARDAVCILVNKANPITSIKLSQLKDIFTGKLKDWSYLGINENPIVLVRRNDNSGTALHFKMRVLEGEEFESSSIIQSTVEELLEFIEENPNAIGFSGLIHSKDARIIAVDDVLPTKENVKNGRYPLSRYLHLYTISTPTGAVKDFIDWIISSAGQKIIEGVGFIPLFEIAF